MWFQLNTTFSTHLGALSTLQSNYGVTYSLSNFTKDFTDPTHCPDMVAKNGSITVTLTMAPNTTFSVASITDGTNQTSYSQTDVVNNKLTMTLAEVKGPVTVIARAISTVVEPTMYTFTINPNPADATVVLTATGYTQVENSITVPAGTSVNYTVSKTGYVTERDVKLVSGDETITINLVEEEPEDPSGGTVEGEVPYTYELGKSIRSATGEILEGDNYAHLTLITIPQVDKTKSLMMKLANGYSYRAFYYKGDTFVAAMGDGYEEVASTTTGIWLLVNGYTENDFDNMKIIYKQTSGSATTTPAEAPADIGLEFMYKFADEYELGLSLQSNYGYFLYDEETQKYSHITAIKPITYNDDLKFSINTGYVWALYAFDRNMNYLGTHDGATSSPWETATSNYAVSQVKTLWSNVAYIVAAFKTTNGASGDTAVTPNVAGARFD